MYVMKCLNVLFSMKLYFILTIIYWHDIFVLNNNFIKTFLISLQSVALLTLLRVIILIYLFLFLNLVDGNFEKKLFTSVNFICSIA